jgi:hypothetical protein
MSVNPIGAELKRVASAYLDATAASFSQSQMAQCDSLIKKLHVHLLTGGRTLLHCLFSGT